MPRPSRYSRGLSETGCRYPRVRELIKQAKFGRADLPTSMSEVIARLRAESADLKAQQNTHKATVLAHFNARDKAENEAARERRAASRLRKEIAERGKVVTIVPRETE